MASGQPLKIVQRLMPHPVDWKPMTKYQILAEVFIVVSFQTEKKTAWPDFLLKRDDICKEGDENSWFIRNSLLLFV